MFSSPSLLLFLFLFSFSSFIVCDLSFKDLVLPMPGRVSMRGVQIAPVQTDSGSIDGNTTSRVTTGRTYEVSPIVGCPQLDFSIAMTIGTPQQGPFYLIVDTGSSTLAVAGTTSTCPTCGGVSPGYDPSQSSTKSTPSSGPTTASSTYGDGSGWSGTIYRDTIHVGEVSPINMYFAAMTTANSFFSSTKCATQRQTTVADANNDQGIAGLGFPAIAANGNQNLGSFMDQLVSQAGITDIFSIQMCEKRGNLWMGGYNANYIVGGQAALQYINLSRNKYYNVYWTGFSTQSNINTPSTYTSLGIAQSVLGKCSQAGETSRTDCAIMDSGSTQFSLPQVAYDALVTAIKSYNNGYFNTLGFPSDYFDASATTCGSAVNVPIATLNANLPKMRITLSNTATSDPATDVVLELNAVSSYLLHFRDPNGNNYYCPGISGFSDTSGAFTIFGWSVMNQFITVHDRTTTPKRMGFGPMDSSLCNIDDVRVMFAWSTPVYSACSAACGGGTMTSTVPLVCLNAQNATVANSYCLGVSVPPQTVPCNYDVACTSTTYNTLASLRITALSFTPASVAQGGSVTLSWTTNSPGSVTLFLATPATPFYYTLGRGLPGSSASFTIPTTVAVGTYSIMGSIGFNNRTFNASTTLRVTAGSYTDPCSLCVTTHGQCLPGGSTCVCSGGWSDSHCSTPPSTCSLQCANKGTLDSTACTCSCLSGYYGPDCSYQAATVTLPYSTPYATISQLSQDFLRQSLLVDLSVAIGSQDCIVTVTFAGSLDASKTNAIITLKSQASASSLTTYVTAITKEFNSALNGAITPFTNGQSQANSNVINTTPADTSSTDSKMYVYIGAAVGGAVVAFIVYSFFRWCCRGSRESKQNANAVELANQQRLIAAQNAAQAHAHAHHQQQAAQQQQYHPQAYAQQPGHRQQPSGQHYQYAPGPAPGQAPPSYPGYPAQAQIVPQSRPAAPGSRPSSQPGAARPAAPANYGQPVQYQPQQGRPGVYVAH